MLNVKIDLSFSFHYFYAFTDEIGMFQTSWVKTSPSYKL